jgi:RimJ/RimL family protein N-acetyltransferase
MSSLQLFGKKIFLSPITLDDVTSEYLSWLHDPEVMKGIETSGYTMKSLQQYIRDILTNDKTEMFTIKDIISKKHIGNIKLVNDFKNNHSELGILIGDKNYWGKGIGSEACSLIVEYAFNTHNMNKVWLTVHSNNPAAYQLYKKLGFKEEGCLKEHIKYQGKYIDKYLMAIYKKNWNK